jgi:hypothetical protein
MLLCPGKRAQYSIIMEYGSEVCVDPVRLLYRNNKWAQITQANRKEFLSE